MALRKEVLKSYVHLISSRHERFTIIFHHGFQISQLWSSRPSFGQEEAQDGAGDHSPHANCQIVLDEIAVVLFHRYRSKPRG